YLQITGKDKKAARLFCGGLKSLAIYHHGIPPEDIYHMDETGFSFSLANNEVVATK
ncbi:MAG: hypothetical protein SEPTF4163_005011, partial [Sporothrix epigloea]